MFSFPVCCDGDEPNPTDSGALQIDPDRFFLRQANFPRIFCSGKMRPEKAR